MAVLAFDKNILDLTPSCHRGSAKIFISNQLQKLLKTMMLSVVSQKVPVSLEISASYLLHGRRFHFCPRSN